MRAVMVNAARHSCFCSPLIWEDGPTCVIVINNNLRMICTTAERDLDTNTSKQLSTTVNNRNSPDSLIKLLNCVNFWVGIALLTPTNAVYHKIWIIWTFLFIRLMLYIKLILYLCRKHHSLLCQWFIYLLEVANDRLRHMLKHIVPHLNWLTQSSPLVIQSPKTHVNTRDKQPHILKQCGAVRIQMFRQRSVYVDLLVCHR